MSFEIDARAQEHLDAELSVEHEALKKKIGAVVSRHTVIKMISDLMVLTISFSVSTLIANEFKVIHDNLKGSAWPYVVYSGVVVLAAVILMMLSVHMAHVDRNRESIRTRLLEIEKDLLVMRRGRAHRARGYPDESMRTRSEWYRR